MASHAVSSASAVPPRRRPAGGAARARRSRRRQEGSAAAGGSPRPPFLTPEQLRDCLAQKDKLAKADRRRREVARPRSTPTRPRSTAPATALAERGDDARPHQRRRGRGLQRQGRSRATPRSTPTRPRPTRTTSRPSACSRPRTRYEKACANRRYDDRDLNDLQEEEMTTTRCSRPGPARTACRRSPQVRAEHFAPAFEAAMRDHLAEIDAIAAIDRGADLRQHRRRVRPRRPPARAHRARCSTT